MSKYDQLEQLNRLRESGALTDAEFDIEKAKLIADRPSNISVTPKYAAFIGIAVIALIVAAVATTAFWSGPARDLEMVESADAVGDNDHVEMLMADAASDFETPSSGSPTFEWAFSDQVIGLNPAYLEGLLGPAKEKTPSSWTFEVQGCDIWYSIANSAVENATTSIRANCQPVVQDRRITPSTTFGDIGLGSHIVRASCIYNCGNAADPTIDLFRGGFRANNNIDVVYRGNYGDGQASAMDGWRQSIRRARGLEPDGYDGDDYEWYQCVASPPAAVAAMLRSENISMVTFGRNIDPDCSYPD